MSQELNRIVMKKKRQEEHTKMGLWVIVLSVPTIIAVMFVIACFLRHYNVGVN